MTLPIALHFYHSSAYRGKLKSFLGLICQLKYQLWSCGQFCFLLLLTLQFWYSITIIEKIMVRNLKSFEQVLLLQEKEQKSTTLLCRTLLLAPYTHYFTVSFSHRVLGEVLYWCQTSIDTSWTAVKGAHMCIHASLLWHHKDAVSCRHTCSTPVHLHTHRHNDIHDSLSSLSTVAVRLLLFSDYATYLSSLPHPPLPPPSHLLTSPSLPHPTSCRADSITWDSHKMLTVPLYCSALLVQHKGLLAECNSAHATYLFQKDKVAYDTSLDTGDKTIQCGRTNDAFKFWVMWKAMVGACMLRRCMYVECNPFVHTTVAAC